jgi:steroid delta-isomerase-like uncharacterized protein
MSASNKAIVQRFFNEGLNNRDFSAFAELLGDCIYHMPLVGELRGEALKQFFGYLFDAFPDIQRTVEEQVTDDNQTVVTRWRAVGTHQREFMGIAPTGKRVNITGISIHRVASGKIVEEWQEWDSLGLMQQLGAVPSFKFEAKAA